MDHQKPNTFKFTTVIFLILGLITPCWPATLPLFWVIAYATYKYGIELQPDETLIFNSSYSQGQLYLTNERFVLVPLVWGSPMNVNINQIKSVERFASGLNARVNVEIRDGSSRSIVMPNPKADILFSHIEKNQHTKR